MIKYIVIICAFLTFNVANAHTLDPLKEYRYCGEPRRHKDGKILRRIDVLSEFKKHYPCPATGKMSGSCPGWAIDHVIPLACGGCDAIINLQWLPNDLKSKAVIGKDRFERTIYEKDIECDFKNKITQGDDK
jgi:hypothetical protein